MRKLKKIAVFTMVLAAALLLSGCMKMHIGIVWNEDNSAKITITYGIQKSALEIMESSAEDVQQQMRESMEAEGEGYSFRNFSDSDYVGVIATVEVDDITKNSVDSLDTLTFRCEETGKNKVYTVSGRIEGSDVAGDSSDLDDLGISLDSIDMKIIIEMPGNITSNNAGEKKGNTLTWVLDPAVTTSIQATSESGGGSVFLWILLIVLIVIFIGIIIAILILSKKKKESAQGVVPAYESPAYGASTYQAPGAYPPAYAPPEQQYAPPAYAPPEPQYVPPAYAPPEQQSAPPAYAPPEQQYAPPAYIPPEQQYAPPAYTPPEPQYTPPAYAPPEQQYAPPEQQYAPPEPQYAPPAYAPPEPQYAPPAYTPPEPQQQTPPPQHGNTPPVSLRCAQCGAEVSPGSKFCTVCGTPTGNQER